MMRGNAPQERIDLEKIFEDIPRENVVRIRMQMMKMVDAERLPEPFANGSTRRFWDMTV